MRPAASSQGSQIPIHGSRSTPGSKPSGHHALGGEQAPLPREFYNRPVLRVSRDLLGMILVRLLPDGRRLTGRIVEVEAYDGPGDLACHASRGRTARTEPMFGESGHAYIYLVYGMYHCLNVVTSPAGYPAAVLIRAVEPIEGIEAMNAGRSGRPSHVASGPGRLTRAFKIDLSLNRSDLCIPASIWIAAGEPVPSREIARGPRIGVDYAGSWARKPWRLGVCGHPALSRPFPET